MKWTEEITNSELVSDCYDEGDGLYCFTLAGSFTIDGGYDNFRAGSKAEALSELKRVSPGKK